VKKLFTSCVPTIAVVGGILAGCAVGPDFHQPLAPSAKGYTEGSPPKETVTAQSGDGAAQKFVSGLDIPGQWWTIFRSEPLDRLIRQALADSPSLAAAQATLREAQENLGSRTGAVRYPAVDANLSAVRQQVPGATFGQPNAGNSIFNLFHASVNVSYTLDFFGGGRRELEGLKAQVDYQRFQLEGAYLALTANIVSTAVQEASLREQIRATREILAAQQQQLDLIERRFQLGGATRPDVLAQKAQLAQTLTTLPPLEKELARTRHLLAVLAGKFPSDAELPRFEMGELKLPVELPVSLPSSLVRQRPDIRASEELLHAAGAQVGVATANLYPKITLGGTLGSTATKVEDLFSPGTAAWSLSAGLLQPIFHGGELAAMRRASVAAYDQAAALYRSTVLQAFQNVADVLRALEKDAEALSAQAQADAAARESLDLARKEFEIGAASYLSLLNAERQQQQALIGLVQAQSARYADTAALFQALGGGWWNRPSEDIDAASGAASQPLTGVK
jgi:NodT family efflux transporter outer membrane factor (OMF) lipoprotein